MQMVLVATRFIERFTDDSETFSEFEASSICSYRTVPQNMHTVS